MVIHNKANSSLFQFHVSDMGWPCQHRVVCNRHKLYKFLLEFFSEPLKSPYFFHSDIETSNLYCISLSSLHPHTLMQAHSCCDQNTAWDNLKRFHYIFTYVPVEILMTRKVHFPVHLILMGEIYIPFWSRYFWRVGGVVVGMGSLLSGGWLRSRIVNFGIH